MSHLDVTPSEPGREPLGQPDPFRDVRSAIDRHGEELAQYPGVISIRPGYRFRDGEITDEPAIIVSVLRKQPEDALDPAAHVPPRVGGVVVDVVPAGVDEQLRAARASGAADTPSGAAAAVERLAAGTAVVDTRTLLEAESGDGLGIARFAPGADYPEPPRALQEVDEDMTLVLHASPDAGWRLLREFLTATRRRLTATMYEFTAPYILDALVDALPAPRTCRLVMDYEEDPNAEVDNPRVVRRLRNTLRDRLDFAWAPVVSDRVTTVGYFPTSYHIKVAVRDGRVVWLSSGNWKPSGQPEVDPLDPPADFRPRTFQRAHNREWHVIADSPGLAEQFEYFIRYDLDRATAVQATGPQPQWMPPAPDVFIPDPALAPEPFAVARFFREETLTKRMRVRPLLTPRHFVEHVLPLLEGAQHRVWFQNQSLSPKADDAEFTRLFNALRDKSRDNGVDTRIIVRGDFKAGEIMQKLKQARFRTSRVRLQNGCHTKGLIIDDTAVVVGSHNWTGQGTRQNRDASLIIYDPDAVAYYERLFNYDWSNLASSRAPARGAVAVLAPPGAPTPPGMRRVSHAEFAE